jgi:hypothetical protein
VRVCVCVVCLLCVSCMPAVCVSAQGCTRQGICVSAPHLPVAEYQLWTSQSTGSLAYLISESEALGHRKDGLDDEHLRPLLHLLL